jgi:anthranilate synthase/aminodeoxychorismate synthase-like glutamine amidotransferase
MHALAILLLDNKDSFVWNLAQAFATLGAEVAVVRSDALDADAARARDPDAIVLSPGPGRPEDAGASVDVVRALSGSVPILGVCLGHQAIGHAFGASIDRAAPCHGKPWPIHHGGDGLFRGLPTPLLGCRYHSLVVRSDTLPACLVPIAWTGERILMAMRHAHHPTFGVQFHPESFRTEHGSALLARFLELAR